jgi:hypothetical protein
MPIKEDIKIGLLKDEYLLLQKFYEDFDARIMTIKGWSATIGLAAIGAGVYQTPWLWLFAAGSALVFWSLEAVWKSLQYMYRPRIRAIEQAFATGEFSQIAPLQAYASWFDAFEQQGLCVFARMRMGIVAFPHAITLVIGMTLFLARLAGWAPAILK